MKRLYLYALTSLLVTSSVATGVTVLGGKSHNGSSSSTNNSSSSPSTSVEELTPQTKFLNNIMNSGNIDLNDAQIKVKYKENDIDVNINGTVSFSMIPSISIKACGTVAVRYDSSTYSLDFTYIDSSLYVSTTMFGDLKMKLDIPTFSEGIKTIIPLFQEKIDTPEDSELNKVLDIDTDSLLSKFTNLEFKSISDSEYKTTFTLNDYLALDIYTDKDYKLTKVDLENLNVKDVTINADINTKLHKNNNKVKLPEQLEEYDDYTDIYNFVSSGYAIANQKEFNLGVSLDLKNKEDDFIGFDGDVAFDLANMKFDVKSKLNYNEHEFDVFTQFNKEKGLYFSLNDLLKGRLNNDNISSIKNIIEGYLDSDILTYVKDKINTLTKSNEFEDIKNHKFNDYIEAVKDISYKDNKIVVKLDGTQLLGSNCEISLSLAKDNNAITHLEIEDFTYEDYKGTLNVNLNAYEGIIDADDKDFEDYSPIIDIYDEIKLLSNEKEFGFTVNNLTFTNNSYEPAKTYTITNGHVQFKLDETETETGVVKNNSCYVDITLNDGVSDHQLVLDMHNEKARIMYKNRNEVYGEIEVGTIKEMIKQIMTLFESDNPLFSQIAALIPSGEEAMLLLQFLKKDFSNLSLDLLKGFSIGSDRASITVDKKILGLNEDLTLNVNYENRKLTSINIPNIAYKTLDIALTASMSTYNKDLGLSDEHNYLDLNLLKIITTYGIPMMDYSQYKLSGQVNLNIHIGKLKLESFEIPLDVYIHNNNGNAEVKIDVKHIPTIDIIGVSAFGYHSRLESDLYSKKDGAYKTSGQASTKASNKDDRHATMVIKDGYVYIERSETGLFYKAWSASKIEEVYTRSVKVTTEEFVSNIYQYLLSDLLGFSSTLCNTIINSTGEGNSMENMQFDKLINNLSYEEINKSLNIGLEMSAITGNDAIKNTKVSIVHSDDSSANKFLKEFKLSMDIASMIDVNATLSINEDNMGDAVFNNNLINDYCNNYAYGDGRYYSHSNSKN